MDPTWTAGPGSYTDPANWLGGVVPNGVNHVARFAGSGSAVVIPSPITLGAIKFDTTQSYVLSGGPGATITLQGGSPLVSSAGGAPAITAPLLITQGTAFVVGAGSLTVGNVSYASLPNKPIMIVKGGAGELLINRVEAQTLRINQGSLRLIAGVTPALSARLNRLLIAGDATPTAKLDVTRNAVVVDYTGSENSPFATIKAQITSGYASGAWSGNGIVSSLANSNQFGVGYAEASSLTSIPAIFGTVDSDAVLVRYTRYGDANLDGTVNLQDFNRLAGNFGSTNADWSRGDFNYDMTVNLQDFNRLAANFGLTAAGPTVTPGDWSALAAAVPEPGCAALLGSVGLTLVRRRKRCGWR
jgi:hypothetical protein